MGSEGVGRMALTSTIARLATVPESQKESMFLLHSRYFCNVHRDAFFNDMNQKDWVIILREGREIVGFSTLQVLRCTVDDAERVFLFSGDTVVDRAHWQDSTLAGSFGHLMLRAMAEYDTRFPLLVPDLKGLSHVSLPSGLLQFLLPGI